MKIMTMLTLAVTMILVAGCGDLPTEQDRPSADQALERSVRAELDRHGNWAAREPKIGIRARDGIVTLTGSAGTATDRETIDTIVRNAPGVFGVNDKLELIYPPSGALAGRRPAPIYTNLPAGLSVPAPVTVSGPVGAVPREYPSPQVRAAGAADETLAHHIADQLIYDSVPAEWCQRVKMAAAGGNVFLQGMVSNEHERQAILSSVQNCQGVRAVYDQLEVQ